VIETKRERGRERERDKERGFNNYFSTMLTFGNYLSDKSINTEEQTPQKS